MMSEEYGKQQLLIRELTVIVSFVFPVTVLECCRMGNVNVAFSHPVLWLFASPFPPLHDYRWTLNSCLSCKLKGESIS